MTMTLKFIAQHLGGRLIGDPGAEVTQVCPIESPRTGGLCVVWTPPTAKSFSISPATACVVPPDFMIEGVSCIQVDNPRAALVDLLHLLHPRLRPNAGIEEGASVSPAAKCADGVFVAAGARIGAGATLAVGVEVHHNAVVGDNVTIGEDSIIFANATVLAGTIIGRRVVVHSGAVIGSDGFGYSRHDDGRHQKIPQIGIVQIEDDVEIGACSTIDRATIGRTIIRRGAKIDNLVQVAHNCDVGEDCVLVGQAGLAGSVTIGDRVRISGQAGVADHVTIGPDVRVGAQAGVAENLGSGDWMGSPAIPAHRGRRAAALAARLPELYEEIRMLLKRCTTLEEQITALRMQPDEE